jgi:hypothetical protein
MLWQLACTERIGSTSLAITRIAQSRTGLFIKRLERTNEWKALMGAMDLEVVQFLSEVDETVEKLKASRGN